MCSAKQLKNCSPWQQRNVNITLCHVEEIRLVQRQICAASCGWLDRAWDVVSKVPLDSFRPAPHLFLFPLGSSFIRGCLRGCYRDCWLSCGVPCHPWEKAHWLCVHGFSDPQLLGDDPASWKWRYRHMQTSCAHAGSILRLMSFWRDVHYCSQGESNECLRVILLSKCFCFFSLKEQFEMSLAEKSKVQIPESEDTMSSTPDSVQIIHSLVWELTSPPVAKGQ